MKRAVLLSLIGIAVSGTLTGCRREAPPAQAASSSPARSVSVDAATESVPAPSAPGVAAPGEAATDEPSGQVSLEQINKAMKEYIVINPTPPGDLAELYRAKLIPKIPVPPPGKVYVVDKKKAQVALVNQP